MLRKEENINQYFKSCGYFKKEKFCRNFSFMNHSILIIFFRKPIALFSKTMFRKTKSFSLKAIGLLKNCIKIIYFKNEKFR